MKINQHPHGHVFYRRMGQHHPILQYGEGVYLYDEEGNRYLDASGGPLVTNIGHGVHEIAEAMGEQAHQAAYMHATMFTSAAIENYANALSEITPLPDAKFYFLSSGSEAVEAALKLARQIQVERGHPNRHIPISRWQSYHGTSLGALAVSGKPKMRALYRPMFKDAPHIPPPYCYRCPFGQEYPQCNLRCAHALDDEIKKQGKDSVMAFIAEPISGATLGAVTPPPEYWSLIREICDEYEIMLIADEVLSGMGRTGKWFGIEHWNITPDIITIGKGAAGGYFPLGIVATRGEYVDLIFAGAGDFAHGGTYSHHAVGAAAGLATITYIQKDDLVTQVAQKESLFRQTLETALRPLECVGDIRGKGLLWGIELVADPTTKEPFDKKIHFAQKVADEAFQRGVIIYPGSGCADGVSGDLVMLGPPFAIQQHEIEFVVNMLREAVLAVMKQIGNA